MLPILQGFAHDLNTVIAVLRIMGVSHASPAVLPVWTGDQLTPVTPGSIES